MTTKEQDEYQQTRVVVERVFRRVGIQRRYERRDWLRDENLLRESVSRKRALHQEQAAQIRELESWRHGKLV